MKNLQTGIEEVMWKDGCLRCDGNRIMAGHITNYIRDEGYVMQEKKSHPKIVCLCGSTRFMEAFFEAGWKFTLRGYIVLSVGVCKHAEHHGAEALGQDIVEKLDELHLRKIDLADEVFVINVGGYIGESTSKEIEYAKKIGKPISYLGKQKQNTQGKRR